MAENVVTFNPAGIPGLGQPRKCSPGLLPLHVGPTLCEQHSRFRTDLGASHSRYNKLPKIEDQAELQIRYAKNIMAMLAIIDHHSMGAYFRVHSAHSHGTIPDGTVRLEADMGTNGMKWNRATAIENLAANQMRPTIFKLAGKKWIPVEFAKGPTDLMVLEVGDFAKDGDMGSEKVAELEIQWGSAETLTVVVPVHLLADRALVHLIPTGWNVKANAIGSGSAAHDPEQPDPGTYWVSLTRPQNTHKVFFGSAETVTAQLPAEKLVEMGFISSDCLHHQGA